MSDNEMLYCLIAFTLGYLLCLHMGNRCIVEPFNTKTRSMFKTSAERNAFCRTMSKVHDKCLTLEENHENKSLCNSYNDSLRKTNDLLQRLLAVPKFKSI